MRAATKGSNVGYNARGPDTDARRARPALPRACNPPKVSNVQIQSIQRATAFGWTNIHPVQFPHDGKSRYRLKLVEVMQYVCLR